MHGAALGLCFGGQPEHRQQRLILSLGADRHPHPARRRTGAETHPHRSRREAPREVGRVGDLDEQEVAAFAHLEHVRRLAEAIGKLGDAFLDPILDILSAMSPVIDKVSQGIEITAASMEVAVTFDEYPDDNRSKFGG